MVGASCGISHNAGRSMQRKGGVSWCQQAGSNAVHMFGGEGLGHLHATEACMCKC